MQLTASQIAKMMDVSCVQADSTREEIKTAVEIAKKYNCICVFALPAHTPFLINLVKDRPDILVGGAVGFPDGGASTEGKVLETTELVNMGVNEIDMVINIAWLKAGEYELVRNDIASVIQAAKRSAG